MREYILSNEEAKRVDNHVIREMGISGTELMRRAGKAVALKAKEMLKDVPGSRVDVFCGTGNNGGDGFVAALNLHDWGAVVYTWVLGPVERIKGDALHFYKKCKEYGLNIRHVLQKEDIKIAHDISESDLIIDAIFGTGFRGGMKEPQLSIVKIINDSGRPVISVDIPSGVNGDTGEIVDVAVKSEATVTMGFLKRGLLLYPGKKHVGELTVVDIGYPEEAFEILREKVYLLHDYEVRDIIPPISGDTYKHRQGKVLVFAGSVGMTGAAALVCSAAMRTGAGLVVNAIPRSLNDIMEVKLTEALTLPVEESANRTFCVESLDERVIEKIEWSDVVVFGPGVSFSQSVVEFAIKLFEKCRNKLIVIDADGLKVFRNRLDLLKELENVILTPHLGEFSFIVEKPIDEIRRSIIDTGRTFAKDFGCVLVLKGAPTILFNCDGEVVFNSTGNPGLATGGTGDVLTGMISSFVAQGMDMWSAAKAGVFLHGYAADKIVENSSMRGLIAGDIIRVVPEVLKQFEKVDR